MTKNNDTSEVNNSNLKSGIEQAESDSSSLSVESELRNLEDFSLTSTLPLLTEEQDDISGTSIPPSSELMQVLETIQSLSTEFKILQQGFDSKIKYDASKERIIDTLHKELQTYRESLHFKILRPVFMDLIAMYDDLNDVLKHHEPRVEIGETEAKLRRNLETFPETIEEILYRNGVEIYKEAGDDFFAQRQRSIKTINTNDPDKDRKVAERVRPGFEYEGRILRPELVITFRYPEQQVEN